MHPQFLLTKDYLKLMYKQFRASQVALVGKNPPAGDIRDLGSIPGSGRSPRRGHGDSLQYSCLENPMDRGAWRATIHEVGESDTTEAAQEAHMNNLGF